MTNQSIYILTITMALGFFSMSSFDFSTFHESNNNTFTFLDSEKIIHQDSTPQHSRSKETYRTNDNGQRVYLSIVDGEIKKFKINGRKIPSSEYGQYAELVQEMRSSKNVPAPPIPAAMEEIEKAHEAIADAHLQIEEAHKEIELAHQEIEKKHGKTSEAIAQALIDDGLISDKQNYKIYLSKKKLKVNGKVQDKTTHQKYLRFYEKLMGSEMNNNSAYRVIRNDF